MRVPTLPNMTVDPENVASNFARSDYIPVQPMTPIASIKAPLPPNPSNLGNACTSRNHPMSLACSYSAWAYSPPSVGSSNPERPYNAIAEYPVTCCGELHFAPPTYDSSAGTSTRLPMRPASFKIPVTKG